MIVPFGKSKNSSDSLRKFSLFNQFDQEEDITEDIASDEESDSEDGNDGQPEMPIEGLDPSESTIEGSVGKAEKLEKYLNETLGGPTLDNLMVVLTAVGMSKISLSLSEDKSSLSVSGVINLSDDKIKKEK